MARHLSADPEADLVDALEAVLPTLQGAFSLVIADNNRLIGVRDPNGFRPLCLGRLDTGWVLASETPALDIVGAHFVREVDPGEMLVIDEGGHRTMRPFPAERHRPQAVPLRVRLPGPARQPPLRRGAARQPGERMGEMLADQSPVARRHGDGRARLGHPGGRGLRPAQRHPLRPGPGQEPVHRPHVHRRRTRWSGIAACGASSTRSGKHRGQAAGRRRRLHRPGHDDQGRGQDAPRRRGERGPPADLARRPTAGRASTGSIPAPAPSSSPPTSRSARSATTSAPTAWPTSSSTPC